MICRKKRKFEPVQAPIAPMIDCVFLLLIYFMVTSSLEEQEADIAFQLPGIVEQDEPLEMPDEQFIEISDIGQVVVNEFAYDTPESSRFTELGVLLKQFKLTSDANKTEARVTIAPGDQVQHQTIVKVMDACEFAGISIVNFALTSDSM